MTEEDRELHDKETFIKFFTCEGWNLFSILIKDLISAEDCEISKIQNGWIDSTNLSKLNFCLGKKKAYQTVLAFREELCGDEENSPEDQGVK